VQKCDAGLNPKVNNLIPAYKSSKYELILISDSNVMVDKDYLKEIVKHMKDPNVGIVSNIIKGSGGSTISSIFENLHMNSFIIGGVCFLDRFLKMPCVVGKSMLMRKKDLEAIGGFEAVKNVLAEDYVIGEKIHKMGKKVVLSNHAINNVNEYWGIKRFLNRHTRWGKLRWKLGGIKYISELIGNPVFMSIIAMLLWDISRITVSFALFVSFTKVMGDLYLRKIMDSDSNPMVYLLAPVKDIIIGLIWFVPILSNTVVWRGNRYIIGKDSMLSPCPETRSPQKIARVFGAVVGMWTWRYRIVNAIKARIA
jgi:ceramide glucosyltransferase